MYNEERLQTWCVRWFDAQYPQLSMLLHHSPNGGARTPYEGKAFKWMGTRAGFPDLILLVPRGSCPYLCIELKSDKGRQQPTQVCYQRAVEAVGARYAICRSFDEFMELINSYLNV